LQRILIIQTAFLGDVILASPVWENLHAAFPNAQIDVVVKKGNESLLAGHPFIENLYIFDKSQKVKNLWKLGKSLRANQYDLILNLQRFASSGLLTFLARGKESRGFDKNPFAFLYTKRYKHQMKPDWHEVDRNLSLISDLVHDPSRRPRLHPSLEDSNAIQIYQEVPYYCLAPTSVWFTKQAPKKIWLELIFKFQKEQKEQKIYLLGAALDRSYLDEIVDSASSTEVVNLAGKLTLLQAAALMAGAQHNYVNDSGPLHLASATNAPVTAFFCSTVPEFGFGPLSEQANIVEVKGLDCRPCGLHGYKSCPKGHFKCGELKKPSSDGF
jgi:heptosyltransferase-2